MTVDSTTYRPVPFEGADDQRTANRATHMFIDHWFGEDSVETRCSNCDCRPSHIAADYPCGAEVPRAPVVVKRVTAEEVREFVRNSPLRR